ADGTIQVHNTAPTITVSGANDVNEGAAYSLTLNPVVDPGNDTISNYKIDWGDGNILTYTAADVALAGGGVVHHYADDNPTATLSDPYTIQVYLQDEDIAPGFYPVAATKSITVHNVDPIAAIVGAPASSPEGTLISVTSSVTDVLADTFMYAWTVTK